MFTGLIDHCGKIHSIEVLSDYAMLTVGTQFLDLQLGESIAVDGICITVVKRRSNEFSCELSPETLSCTKVRGYEIGSRVNLERALQLTERLSGHFVSGHVCQTALVASQEKHVSFIKISFKNYSSEPWEYLLPKGSVAVNGVSLTVNSVFADYFSVILIPHTLEGTNLSDLREGQLVNIEFDLITKIIVQKTREALHHAGNI